MSETTNRTEAEAERRFDVAMANFGKKMMTAIPTERLLASALADRLDEQGCDQDAELVRRLAGITGPGASGAR